MSRIGRTPIVIPQGVKIEVDKKTVTVEGPNGKLSRVVAPALDVDVGEKEVTVERRDESKHTRALHGLYRSLLNNMIVGVSEGFTVVLTISGVGYRAEVQDKTLLLNLGYSNPIEYPIPEDIIIEVESNNKITIKGNNKERVGQVGAEIRSFRPPEPYKGKGVKYETELVKRKIGKSGIK